MYLVYFKKEDRPCTWPSAIMNVKVADSHVHHNYMCTIIGLQYSQTLHRLVGGELFVWLFLSLIGSNEVDIGVVCKLPKCLQATRLHRTQMAWSCSCTNCVTWRQSTKFRYVGLTNLESQCGGKTELNTERAWHVSWPILLLLSVRPVIRLVGRYSCMKLQYGRCMALLDSRTDHVTAVVIVNATTKRYRPRPTLCSPSETYYQFTPPDTDATELDRRVESRRAVWIAWLLQNRGELAKLIYQTSAIRPFSVSTVSYVGVLTDVVCTTLSLSTYRLDS